MRISLSFLLRPLPEEQKEELAESLLKEHIRALGQAARAELPQLTTEEAERVAAAVVRRLIERVL